MAASPTGVHPVDERLPAGRFGALGLRHVLVMCAGAISVPLIVGRALKLSPEQVAVLISADLSRCGVAALIQSFGTGRFFGIHLSLMMGVTSALLSPMIAMANADAGAAGAQLIFGSVIGAGIVSIFLAPLVGRMLGLFPPVVTGTVIAVIGITLMRVGINWAVGGMPITASIPDPAHAALDDLGIALFVLAAIVLITKYARGFVADIAVLLGIVGGCVVALAMGKMDFSQVGKARWVDTVSPFAFGMPVFDVVAILTMTLVMVVVTIESTGMFVALGGITGKPVGKPALMRGLRIDGFSTLIGSVFNTFPYTSFSQNAGLVGVTGVRSRLICLAAGVIMVVMGLLPKLAALVESVPQFVLGGAGIVVFGMVAATGIRVLSTVDYAGKRNNVFIVAIATGFGLVPLVVTRFPQWMPKALDPLLHSGILLAAIVAVLLNLFFNGMTGNARADTEAAVRAAKQSEGGH